MKDSASIATVDPHVLAVIPARGGSKGIPRKNLAVVGGIPLVARAVIVARDASMISAVVVSTDDPEIGAIAQRYGATVVARPSDISGDTASSESAIMHSCAAVSRATGRDPEIVVLLQATSPFLTSRDIDSVVRPVAEGSADSAFAAVPFHHFLWGPASQAPGGAQGINHDGGPRQRRQDLDPQYLEAGSAYAMRYAALVSSGVRFCGRTSIVATDPDRCFEIDTPQDLEKARALAPIMDRFALSESLKRNGVDAVAFDFDGVFTDNTVQTDQNGVESVTSSRSDGLGIRMLREHGVPMVVISTEENPVVAARCRKMGLEVYQAVGDKSTVLARWLSERVLQPHRTVYMGNDVNDLPAMELVGMPVCPSDAHPDVLRRARHVVAARGGAGAVRELADAILTTID